MAGPANQSTPTYIIAVGEAQKKYAPTELAWEVRNFGRTQEGTIASVTGPCVYEPDRQLVVPAGYSATLGKTSRPHLVFHTTLQGGMVDFLLVRSGGVLYRHAGWERAWETLETGLTSEGRPRYPDQVVVMNDKIVWSNGIDQARVITWDGMVVPLGFATRPGAPQAYGPQNGHERDQWPNQEGYSWPGRVGTVGEFYADTDPVLLNSAHEYVMLLEDVHGNLSAPSGRSNSVFLSTSKAEFPDGTKITKGAFSGASNEFADSEADDLTKQFYVTFDYDDLPDHAVAVHIYRTADINHQSTDLRFVGRYPNRAQLIPDNKADGELGAVLRMGVPVPIFRVMCTFQGSLIIGNTLEDPGIVRRSVPGFLGQFNEIDYVYPDAGGAEVTALASHGGRLLAFTVDSVFDITDFAFPVKLAEGIGCVAPRSIAAMHDGTLIWLGRRGFYSLRPISTPTGGVGFGAPQAISTSGDRTVRHFLNRSMLMTACSAVDPTSGEYRCFIAPSGSNHNTLGITYDGEGWRRLELGLHVGDICTTMDWRQYQLCIGYPPGLVEAELPLNQPNDQNPTVNVTVAERQRTDVFVLDHETDSDPPARDVVYKSGWLRADDLGLTPMHVRTMYVGLLDRWNGTATVTFYRNGNWAAAHDSIELKLIGVDDGSKLPADIAGEAVVGTAKVHDPRLFWRQIPVGMEDCRTWAFEIRASYPTRIELAALAFDISIATRGNTLGRIPKYND